MRSFAELPPPPKKKNGSWIASDVSCVSLRTFEMLAASNQGCTQGAGLGGGALPWILSSTRFSRFFSR